MTTPSSPLTTKDVAEKIGTDAKTFRVYLRSAGIGKDEATGRYAFTTKDVAKLKKDFTAWQKARTEAKAETAPAE